MIIRSTPEADAELAEAREWYVHQREDLDLEFMKSIDDALSRIVANPHQYPNVYRSLRHSVVRRFPSRFFMRLRRMRSRSSLSSTRVDTRKDGSRESQNRRPEPVFSRLTKILKYLLAGGLTLRRH